MKENDKKAKFTAFYEREADKLFRFCLSRVSDREQARDIVQEVFTRLWGAYAEGKGIDNERAFIFTVARNLIIDWYRKNKPESLDAMFAERNEGLPFEIAASGSDKWAEHSAEARIVVEAIKKLDSISQEVVYMRLVEDFSPGEIAKLIGVTPNTVSVRINRGVSELRKNLGVSDLS